MIGCWAGQVGLHEENAKDMSGRSLGTGELSPLRHDDVIMMIILLKQLNSCEVEKV